jgi:predicted DNA-binding ribbon-helix-helix protein
MFALRDAKRRTPTSFVRVSKPSRLVTTTEANRKGSWGDCLANKKDTLMKSPIVKRSIVIGGHKTSVSLEDAFWRGLKEIARDHRVTLSKMVADIDKSRQQSNLSSAIRLFVLDRLRSPATVVLADGPDRAEAERIFQHAEPTHV